jgi:hypothetical protein
MDFILHYHHNNINYNNIHTQVVTFQISADDHTENCLYMKKIDMKAATSVSSSVLSSSLSVGGCATLLITGTLMKVTSDTERYQLMTHNEELLQFEQYIYDYKSINHHHHQDQDQNDVNHLQFYKLQISAMRLIPYLEGQSSAVPVDIETSHAIAYSALELMDYEEFEDY